MNTQSFDAFNRIALYVLVHLFESFPHQIELDANTIGTQAKPTDSNKAESEIFDSLVENHTLAYSTISWLRDEGFISVGDVNLDSQFRDARLTLKGLTLLGFEGPELENDSSFRNFAEEGARVLREGTRSAATDLVKELILSGLRIGMPFIT